MFAGEIFFQDVINFNEGAGKIFLETSLFSPKVLIILAVLHFIDEELYYSYFGLGRFSFKFFRFLGKLMVPIRFLSVCSFYYSIQHFISKILGSHKSYLVVGRSFWLTTRSFSINFESYFEYIEGKGSKLPINIFLYNFSGVSALKGGFSTAI